VITFSARPFLLVATLVWILWRALLWSRRTDKNPAREVVVAATFLWSLLVLSITLFPLKIIFYDWHATSNVIPFASILEILGEASPSFVFDNIAGNVIMFVPIGILLPTLFEQMKRPEAMLWRAAAISGFIEGTQLVTRARAVDVDDVILNTVGAMIGLGVFSLAAPLFDRRRAGRRLLERTVSATGGEPLLAAALPILLTAAIAIPMMLSVIADETLGTDDIEAVALATLTGGQVVARADVGNHTFVVVSGDTPDGPATIRSDFKKVLPGRYTAIGTSSSDHRADDSAYRLAFTTYNPTAGEQPILVIWGTNADEATTVRVMGSQVDTEVLLHTGADFVAAVELDVGAGGIRDDFRVTFVAEDGTPLPVFRRVDD
jgi:glycopeptide antibiotics resistance protein